MGALREAFPDGRFEAPADPKVIRSVERKLGLTLPAELRALYEENDGFREPTGNSEYLFPLKELISATRFLWTGISRDAPGVDLSPLRQFVFFGGNGLGGWWGIGHVAPHEVVYWHHDLLPDELPPKGPRVKAEYELTGKSIIDTLKAAQAIYHHLD